MLNSHSFNFFCLGISIFLVSSFYGVHSTKACTKSQLFELRLKHLKCVEDLKGENILEDDGNKKEENNLSLQDTICSSQEAIIEKCTKQIYMNGVMKEVKRYLPNKYFKMLISTNLCLEFNN